MRCSLGVTRLESAESLSCFELTWEEERWLLDLTSCVALTVFCHPAWTCGRVSKPSNIKHQGRGQGQGQGQGRGQGQDQGLGVGARLEQCQGQGQGQRQRQC